MAKRACCVGINKYPQGFELQYCVADAMALATMLTEQYEFPHSDVRMILDAEATKVTMLDALRTLVTGAQAGDELTYTYSGHGTYVADQSGDEQYDECLCPVDLLDTLITDDEIREILANLPKGVHMTFISDSCYSGTVTRIAMLDILGNLTHLAREHRDAAVRAYVRSLAKRRVRFLSPHLDFMLQRRLAHVSIENPMDAMPRGRVGFTQQHMNHLLISGCQDDELSYESTFNGVGHGAMTYALLTSCKAARYRATYRQLITAMTNMLVKQWGYPQHPQLEGNSSAKRRLAFV